MSSLNLGRKHLAALIGVALLSLAAAQSPSEGITSGYEQVMRQEFNGYDITLWQLPERVVIGSVHSGVELRDAASGTGVDGGLVVVYAHHERHESQKSTAISTHANPHFYEAMLTLEELGDWQIELRWEAPFEGSVSYDGLVVHERARSGGETVVAGRILFGVVGGGLLVIAALVWWQSRRARRGRLAS